MDRWIVDFALSSRYPTYTRGNIGEVFPLPVTPLTATFGIRQCAEPGWRDAFVRYGAFEQDEFAEDEPEIIGCFGGYGYLNVSISRIMGVRTPGLSPEQVDYSLWGEMADAPPYRPQPSDENPELSERISSTVGWILSTPDLAELQTDQREMAELRANRPDLTVLAPSELVAGIHGHAPALRRLFSEHIFMTYCAVVPVGIIQATCAAVGDPLLAMRLIAGLGDVDSAAPSTAMWRLSRMVASSAALTGLFDAGVSGLVSRLADAGEPDAHAFLKAFDGFLYEYGSRGPNEWEMSSPSWEFAPELALAAIDRMRLAPDDAEPEGQRDQLVDDRVALAASVAEQLADDPEAQAQFAAAVRAAELFLPARERSKTNVIRLTNEIRAKAYELGNRMVAAGQLARKEDLSMLLVSELDDYVQRPADFAATVRERAAAYATLFDVEPPFVIDGTIPPLPTWPPRARSLDLAAPGTTLRGIPGCPGTGRGRARIILDPMEVDTLEPGDVLVAPITDPAWTPLFVPAAAVVVDVGAQLSHAVIVSRELGIPCVVSVTDATRRIPDGAMVEVDGTSGVVTLM